MNLAFELVLKNYLDVCNLSPFQGGASGAALWLVETPQKNYVLKVQTASQANEFKLYQWLQNKIPVPSPLFQINFDGLDYLCMEHIDGNELQIPENQVKYPEMVVQYTNALKRLHQIPIHHAPVFQDLYKRIQLAKKLVEQNQIVREQLQPENQMYSNHTLFEKLMTLGPDSHELVFTHGDFCPENLLFKDHKLKAYIDINRGGVADKYQDIALAIRTITDDIDASFVPLFCETYGIDQLDSQKLAFYTLLDEFF